MRRIYQTLLATALAGCILACSGAGNVPAPTSKDDTAQKLPPEQAGATLSPLDKFRLDLESQKARNPQFVPKVHDHLGVGEKFFFARVGLEIVQVIKADESLIKVNGGELTYLTGTPANWIDDRRTVLSGIFEDTGRHQYQTALGGTKTVWSFHYHGQSPEFKITDEGRIVPPPAPIPVPSTKPAVPKVIASIVPPSGETVLLADNKNSFGIYTKKESTNEMRTQLVSIGRIRLIQMNLEVEWLGDDGEFTRIRTIEAMGKTKDWVVKSQYVDKK